MIKYLIIDDEYIAHDIIKEYTDLLPNLHLVKSCYNALEAIEYLTKNEVDLIFLDYDDGGDQLFIHANLDLCDLLHSETVN